MSLIKIVANNIELDFVKETLKIRKENNAMIRNLKVSANAVPFLIVENKNTKLALGSKEITSSNKVKTIAVQVFENDLQYYGELQVISYLNGFRKCNIKYASEILSIMNTKIADFMPVVSVIPGETTPEAYVEESPTVVAGDSEWKDYVAGQLLQGFPDVKWNFPMMIWKDKFGEKLEADDTWAAYVGKVNATIDGEFLVNTGIFISDTEIEVQNFNVPMPQVYLLAPLFYALQSIGFKYEGDFTSHPLIQKLLMLSTKNNLCKVVLSSVQTLVEFDDVWTTLGTFQVRTEYRTIGVTGSYTINVNFTLDALAGTYPSTYYTALYVSRYRLLYDHDTSSFIWKRIDSEIIFRRKNETSGEVIEGEFTMNFSAGERIQFDYYCLEEVMPLDYELGFRLDVDDKEFQQMHPTINVGRYVPDWTFATYLNQLKNTFNLEMGIDDFRNRLSLNLNEDWIADAKPDIIRKSLAVGSYDSNPNQAFLLKYENEVDTALWIENGSTQIFTNQKNEFSETLDCKFKFVPTTSTAELSDALDDKDGVGLLIYDEANAPVTSASYAGKTLSMDGTGGIWETFWNKWLHFRLNASMLEISGPFTNIEIQKFIKTKRIYCNNQDMVVSLLEYSETKQDNYLVKFKVETVNF